MNDDLVIIVCAVGYLVIGYFVETLLYGEEYSDGGLWIIFLWPLMVAFLILIAPFYAAHKVAMWIRKIFGKE